MEHGLTAFTRMRRSISGRSKTSTCGLASCFERGSVICQELREAGWLAAQNLFDIPGHDRSFPFSKEPLMIASALEARTPADRIASLNCAGCKLMKRIPRPLSWSFPEAPSGPSHGILLIRMKLSLIFHKKNLFLGQEGRRTRYVAMNDSIGRRQAPCVLHFSPLPLFLPLFV
jgi:hypothetical protein